MIPHHIHLQNMYLKYIGCVFFLFFVNKCKEQNDNMQS